MFCDVKLWLQDEEEHTPIEELVLVQNRSEKIEEIKCIEVERNVKIEKVICFYL